MRTSSFISLGIVTLVSLVCSPAYSMTLQQTVEDAIIHNPQFRSEVKKYQSIKADLAGAKADYYPVIDVNAGIGYEEVDNNFKNTTGHGLTRRESSAKLTENLFNGFATQNEVARQQAKLDAQSFKALSQANTTALEMIKAYIGLIEQQQLFKLANENLDTHQKILSQIKKRNDAGIGNEVEVDQARARLALAQSNQTSTHNNYDDALAKFRRVLGRDPDSPLVRPKFTFKLPHNLQDATAIALIDHPTIKSANGDVAEAKAQYDASKQNYYPRVDLEIEKTMNNDVSGYKGNNDDLQAMIRLKYNLYRGGKDKDRRLSTAASYAQSTEIRNKTRRQTIENLRYAWNSKLYTSKQLPYINQHIILTRNTLSGYRKQFRLGRRSLLDVLNTENEYNTALRTLVKNQASTLIANYRILAGMGHLLPNLDISYNFLNTIDHPNE